MSSIQDSKAHFRARAEEYGIDLATVNLLELNGVTTLSHLAFAISRPGQEVDEQKFNDWVVALNGGNPLSMGLTAGLRRLHFEAEIILTSVLKASIEEPVGDTATPKPTPVAERNARIRQMRTDLPGIIIEGDGEPSRTLVDECVHQHETKVLRYIEPAKCHSRESEVVNSKTEKKLKVDSNTLAIRESRSVPDESILNAYNLQRCLKRRGLAYHFAGLISFTAHERYVEALMRHLTLEPPPNFQAVTLNQILRADKEVWLYMSKNVENIRADPAGDKPLDKAMMEALRDYSTAFHLLPLVKEQTWHGGKGKNDDIPGKGRGKGKKGKAAGANAAPRGFAGCTGRDNKNRPICFDYNINDCPHAAHGASCRKGRHVCFKIGCHKPHQYHVAHADEQKAGS